MAILVIGAVFQHLVLLVFGQKSNIRLLINLTGVSALVVVVVLIPWDWLWFFMGGADRYYLGFSHLVISLWATFIVVLGLKRILCVPVWESFTANPLSYRVTVPVAAFLMRLPL